MANLPLLPRLRAVALIALLAPPLAPHARAAMLLWDADPATAGAQDGAGTWDAVGTNWWDGGANVAWPDTASDIAVIGAGSGTANAITVSGTLNLNGIVFATPGSSNYVLSGGTLSLGGVSPTLSVATGVSPTISAILAGSAGFTKAGGGTLRIAGANAYDGATTISSGILVVADSGALGSTAGDTTVAAGQALQFDGSGGSLGLAENINVYTGNGILRNLAGSNTLGGLTTFFSSPDIRINGGSLTFAGGVTNAASANYSASLNGRAFIITKPITLNNGTLTFTSNGNNPANASELNVAGNDFALLRLNFGAYLKLGVANAWPTDVAVQFGWHTNSSSSATLDLNGYDQTVASLHYGLAYNNPSPDQKITGGGMLTVNLASGTNTYLGRITDGSGATALTKDGAGTQILSNRSGTATSYSGVTRVKNGRLQAGTTSSFSGSSPHTIDAGASLGLDGYTNAVGSLAGTGTVENASAAGAAATLTVGGDNTSPTFFGTIQDGTGGGALSLTKTGAGTQTLFGTNTFTGALTVNKGVLTVGGPTSNLAGAINITGASGAATLNVSNALATTAGGSIRAFTIANAAGRTGTVNVGASGSLTTPGMLVGEDGGGHATFTQSGGTVSIGSSGFWLCGNTSALTVAGGSFTSIAGVTYIAAGALGSSASALSVNGTGAITLGTLSFGVSSRNYTTAALNIGNGSAGGTLQVNTIGFGGGTGTSTMNFNGGTLVANGTFGNPAQVGTVVQSGGANINVVSPYTMTIPTALTDGGGGGGLTKSGAGVLKLTASNTYPGATVVLAGTLDLAADGALSSASIAVLAGATLSVTGRTDGALTVSAAQTLAGDGVVRGIVAQAGSVSPGYPIGTLTITGQLSAGGTAVTVFELGGTNSYDRLVVSDLQVLDGTLKVVTTNGYVPATGDQFLLITNTAGFLAGTFGGTDLPPLTNGLGWRVDYVGAEAVSLVVTGSPYAATPYEAWANAITNPALRGDQDDPDGDGQLNLWEYSQGSDPTNGAITAKLQWYRTNGLAVLKFNRATGAVDVVYEVEASYDFTNNALWDVIKSNVFGAGWAGVATVNETNSGPVVQVMVEDNEPLSQRRGMRLRVTRP